MGYKFLVNIYLFLLCSTMFLYNLTLQRATGIVSAIHGNFSGTRLQEIVVSRGKTLDLLRHDPNTGKIYPVLSVEVFGVIRAIMPFRLTGGSKGNFMIFEFQIIKKCTMAVRFYLPNLGSKKF